MKKHLFLISVLVFSLAFLLASCEMTDAIFATPTPTPTNTPTVTPSPTITPSPTPTDTPTPVPTNTATPTPLPETSVEQLADGSTMFTDIKAGYKFVLPKDWMVLNLAVDDPEKVLSDAIKANPDKEVYLQGLSTVIAQKGRMAAIDFNPDHFTDSAAPFLFVILDESSKSASLEDILEANGQVLPQILNGDVTVVGIKENRSGVSYGVIDVVINFSSGGISVSVFEQLIIFQTPDYTVMLTFAAANQLEKVALPDLAKVIDSIEILEP